MEILGMNAPGAEDVLWDIAHSELLRLDRVDVLTLIMDCTVVSVAKNDRRMIPRDVLDRFLPEDVVREYDRVMRRGATTGTIATDLPAFLISMLTLIAHERRLENGCV